LQNLIRPFAAMRPAAQYASAVAAPPYDVLSASEARARAAGNPWSFLHVSKAEIDLPEPIDPYSNAVYAKARSNWDRMIAGGVLARDPQPALYAYRLVMGGNSQTGLVATVAVAAYEANRIRKHELTRPDREDDRVRQIDALNAQTGPVLLVYPAAAEVDEVLAEASCEAPACDIIADYDVRHTIWTIRSPERIARLTESFDAMRALYIADGHHRSAAAARVAAARRARAPAPTGEESWAHFLAVAFPHDRMQILPYHRLVRDLNGASAESFLRALSAALRVEPRDAAVTPRVPSEFGLYMAGRWYALAADRASIDAGDLVARLDVSVLADRVLEPLLGITDPRRDQRIDFAGGIRGLSELERRVDSGEMAAAFSLHPTRMEDLIAVADAGRVMPPKSTWFEPKLADGLVSHVLD
jgi:uncharacterized protein (DUF1015 family)